MIKALDFQGSELWKGLLDRDAQLHMLLELRKIAIAAPFRRYQTPGGKNMSVRMSGAGAVAWVSERSGYSYKSVQPDGRVWPEIPDCVLSVWDRAIGGRQRPDSCLINFYGEGAKMGLHQDLDEKDRQWPVVSISLGDEAQFRVGGTSRHDPTKSIWLQSGDVIVLKGRSRLAYHGIDRIKFGSSDLLDRGGRINVTLRVAT